MTNNIKKLWWIPLQERIIKCDSFGFHRKLMELDNVGFCLWYNSNKPEHLDANFIRRHLTLRHDTFTYIFADTKEEAIDYFYKEFEGAKIGGENKEAKALWISETEYRYIKEIVPCSRRMVKIDELEFRCGYEGASMEEFDEMAGCILDHYDPPDNCPVAKQYELEYEEQKKMVGESDEY